MRIRFLTTSIALLVCSCAILVQTVPQQTTAAPATTERIEKLRAEIARHDQLYYRDASPEITDHAYDQLRIELADLERRFPSDAAASATPHTIGNDRSPRFNSWRHHTPMLSIDNLYDEPALRVWLTRITNTLGITNGELPCTIEPKIDGLAINLIYENGQLTHAATRGDGLVGDDVTANVIASGVAPPSLHTPQDQVPPARVEIRGEICITHDDFQRLNQEREDAGLVPFANPRNLAAGSLKLLDAGAVAHRRLSLVCYAIGHLTRAANANAPAAPATQSDALRQLENWGLPVIKNWVRAAASDGICSAVARLNAARISGTLPWPADGVIVKIDSIAAQSALGASERAPRWAIACKYRNAFSETRLRAITPQVGRTGIITPMAELAPVTIDGATITRATLHNATQITRLDVRIGDTVIIERAGAVIPAIVGVNRDARPANSTPYVFATHCPSCNTTLIQFPNEAAWRCPSSACPAQLQRRLAHYASKPCMDIPGLGSARINDLVQRGLIKTPADLYRLRPEDLASAPGRASGKTAATLINAIAASKQRPLDRLILALGIPLTGPATTRALTNHFTSLESIAEASGNNQLSAIDNLGPAVTASLQTWFQTPANLALIADLGQLGVLPRPATTAAEIPESKNPIQPLAGRVFVLTGTLPSLTRAQATALITSAGGRVTSNITAETTDVVAGPGAGAKLRRARELGLPIHDEATLRRLSAPEIASGQ